MDEITGSENMDQGVEDYNAVDFNIGGASEVFGSDVEIIEQVRTDTDGDGYANVVELLLSSGGTMALADLDDDGIGDVLLVDLDGDGLPELQLVQHGDADSYSLSIDESGDGQFDEAETYQMTHADLAEVSPDLVLMMEQALGWSNTTAEPDPAADPEAVDPGVAEEQAAPEAELVDNDGMVGDPDKWSEHWFNQAENGNCVPASVAQVVSEYSGIEFADEEAFVQLALESGFFFDDDNTNGITAENSVKLLNLTGVPATLEYGDMDALAEALSEDRAVMVGVDADEYWYPGEELVDDNIPNHCVVVSGIDTENGIVYLSDPGTPDGDQLPVPMEVFEDAWADSGNAMIVCDEPAPAADVDEAAVVDEQALASASGSSAAIDYAVDRPWLMLPIVISAAMAVV